MFLNNFDKLLSVCYATFMITLKELPSQTEIVEQISSIPGVLSFQCDSETDFRQISIDRDISDSDMHSLIKKMEEIGGNFHGLWINLMEIYNWKTRFAKYTIL